MENKIKVIVAGKNRIAVDVTRYLLSHHIQKAELRVLFNSTDNGKDSWQPSFKAYATREGLSAISLERACQIPNCLFLSLEFDELIRPEKFISDNLVNIHFSNLPKYKGMYTSIHPILNDETTAGVTLHRIDKGIDTGDVIDSLNFSITKENYSEDLYKNYIQFGTELVIKNANRLLDNTYKSNLQEFNGSSYYSRTSIDWVNIEVPTNRTAYQIFNFVRAFAFRPYQLPTFRGRKIMSARVLPEKSIAPQGTIINEGYGYVDISTVDYNLRLCEDVTIVLLDLAEENNIDRIKNMAAQGFRLDGRSNEGWSLAIVAAYNYSKDTLEWLLSNDWDLNDSNFNGTTLLMYIMMASEKRKDLKWFTGFLTKDINIFSLDNKGFSIIDYAKMYGFTDHLKELNKLL